MRVASAIVVACICLSAAACSGVKSRLPNDPSRMPEIVSDTRKPGSAGFIARLRSIGGSSATGSVSVEQRGDVFVLLVQISNVPPGTYALELHENGNCSSPNGFSAGRAWTPSGAKVAAAHFLPDFTANSEGNATMTARVRGARADGVLGRSVLIYAGGKIEPIRADVPNNAVACGVFEPAKALF